MPSELNQEGYTIPSELNQEGYTIPSELTQREIELVNFLRAVDAQGGAEQGTHAQFVIERLPLIMANLPTGLYLPDVIEWLLARFQAEQGLP